MRFLTTLVAMLIATSLAKWSPPITLSSEGNSQLKGLYTDPSTGIHHLLWFCGMRSSELLYSQVSPAGKVIKEHSFKVHLPSVTHFQRSAITGAGNGRDLFAELSPNRVCFESSTMLLFCYEPYFTESHDGGLTWSNPTPIARPNMVDVCSRQGEELVYQNSTGKVYFFYSKSCGSEDVPPISNDEICYVSKKNDSRVYSPEATLYTTKGQNTETIHTVITSEPGTTSDTIRLFWGDVISKTTSGVFTMSSTNGHSWTKPHPVYVRASTPPALFSLAYSRRVSPIITMSFNAAKGESYTNLLSTRNFGDNAVVQKATSRVTEPGNLYEQHLQAATICAGSADTVREYMFTETAKNSTEYHVWDLNKMTAQKEETPFPVVGRLGGVELSCYVRKDGKIVVSAFAATILVAEGTVQFAFQVYDEKSSKTSR